MKNVPSVAPSTMLTRLLDDDACAGGNLPPGPHRRNQRVSPAGTALARDQLPTRPAIRVLAAALRPKRSTDDSRRPFWSKHLGPPPPFAMSFARNLVRPAAKLGRSTVSAAGILS